MRWLVGDVQGCASELARLLETVRFDPARDELWCLGDLINRGPDSLETLRLWRDVGGFSLLGNHDVYALLAASGRIPRKRDTLGDLFEAEDADELLKRVRSCPALVHLPGTGEDVPGVWIVHAGLNPSWGGLQRVADSINDVPHDDDWLQSAAVSFATRARCCDASGNMSPHNGGPGDCPEPYRPWDEFYRGSALVVHGHWAARGYYRGPRTMGLDSGCVYGGRLTAWCQEEDRIVQIDSIKR